MLVFALTVLTEVASLDEALNRANAYQARAEFAIAEPVYRQALARALHLGRDTRLRGVAHNNFAALYYRTGRYAEAYREYLEAASVWRALGSTIDMAATNANLAELANATGQPVQALRYSEEAIREAALLGDRAGNAFTIHANILRSLGRVSEARQFLARAAQTASPAARGHTLNALAQLELSEGNFEAARTASTEAAALWEKFDGNPSFRANALAVLSRIEAALGNSQPAERLAREVLAIIEKTLGPEHSRVAVALADLAERVKERRLAEAGALLERAHRITIAKQGKNHPDSIALELAMADVERRAGRLEEARKVFARSVEGARALYGSTNAKVAPYLNNAALALVELGQHGEAEALLREAVQIREKEVGPMHVSNAETYLNLAVVLTRRGERREARSFAERSLAVRQMHYGADHPSMLTGLELYGRLLLADGEKRRARDVNRRSEALIASDPERRNRIDIRTLQSGFRPE